MSSADVEAKAEAHHKDPITMTRFLLDEQRQHKSASGNFTMVLQSIQLACKAIANATKKSGIASLYGIAGDQNSSGEDQKKLDVFANEVFINCLTFSQEVYIMCSEENADPIVVADKNSGYSVVFDPLDGSSNIEANISVGTIFGIYRKDQSTARPSAKDLLRPGRELVAAGYALYGSATILVISTGRGVHGFTLDPVLGEFILTHKDIQIPKKGKIYSINEGNAEQWDDATKAFVQACKTKPAKSARYVGSMVADVHRTLLYGGIFCYPGDAKNPDGKLRLLYECNPMAFLVEHAGGKATTGTQRVLDIVPTKLHQRKPIFLGSADDVAAVEQYYKQHPGKKTQQNPKARL